MNQHDHTTLENLLVKYLLREASPDEIRTVETWLSASPDNQQVYQQVKLIWEESLHLSGEPRSVIGEEELAWQQLRQRIHRSATGAHPTPGARPAILPLPRLHASFRWLRVAAVLLLTLSISLFAWWWSNRSTPVMLASGTTSLRDTLTDGSIVTLNRHSSLTYISKFKKDERSVTLHGEAFFQVAPDKSRPFQVHTAGVTITVMGTSFNVHTSGDTTEIIVETGLIKVNNGHQDILLHPSEKLTLVRQDSVFQKGALTDKLYQYYRTREFVCEDIRLDQLVETLNKAYDAHIEIGNLALRSMKITAVYREESLDRILSLVTETLGISMRKENGRIILQ